MKLPAHFQITLRPNTDFTRNGFGKRVEKIGGSYAKAAGRRNVSARMVRLPNTGEGRALGNELVSRFGFAETQVIWDSTYLVDICGQKVDSGGPDPVGESYQKYVRAAAEVDQKVARFMEKANEV